jgi:uncharacterized protein (DUF1501 family)
MATRREVLKVGLGTSMVVSLCGSVPAFLSRFAYAEDAHAPDVSNDNVLVVVQLSGGNDGLNTVIPVNDDAYFKARPRIGLKDLLLKINDQFALNPGLTGFKELYDSGHLAIINGCGYPSPNRSHFRSMEIWHTANPKESEPCGWLGHYLDHCIRGTTNPVEAVNIGTELPQALVAESAPVPSIQTVEDFRVKTDPFNPNQSKEERELIRQFAAVRAGTPALEYLTRQATNAILSVEKVQKLTAGYKPDAEYKQGFGYGLRTIAQLISANLGTKLFYCQIGGFDTHAAQVNGHEQTLATLAAGIAAFHKDLSAKGLNNKVTVMCFSEFGRRVEQNFSNGTDHGAAGPMFLSGGRIKGGMHGSYPSLTQLEDGDLKYTTDFRSVYATLLENWLNADSTKVLKTKFSTMDFFA